MCGVIGYKPITPQGDSMALFRRLFDESRIRGHHAYGMADSYRTSKSFQWEEAISWFNPHLPTIGHTRYCQSGDWQVMDNNQPLVVGNMKLAMNGVIHMGTKEEFEQAYDVQCKVDNDSEIFLQKLAQGRDAAEFIAAIPGSFAAVWLVGDRLFAGRNARRPLWVTQEYGAKWVASTGDIFKRAGFTKQVEMPVGVMEI